VKKSDVFLQNYRKGVAQRLKLDYATLSKINPKLVYATISGWGPKGPDKNRPSFDFTGLARSGIMTTGGEEGDPPYNTQAALTDQLSGIMGANTVVNALLMRERWGIGQEVETSMLGGAMVLMGLLLDIKLLGGYEQPKWSRSHAANPLWNIYKCKDDNWLALALLQPDRYWPDVCRALGLQNLENDPRFNNLMARNKNCAEMVSILDKVFATKPRAEWLDILSKHGDLLFEPVNTIPDIVKDPQVWANNYITEFEHPAYGKTNMVGFPMHFSQAEQKIRMPAPEFGQHTEEVLHELLGYSWEKIEELRGKEII
jgi:CoA:oxalate CoA-transferase